MLESVSIFVQIVVALALTFAALVLPGYALVRRLSREMVDPSMAFLLSPSASAAFGGALFVGLFHFDASRRVFGVALALALAWTSCFLWRKKRYLELRSVDRDLRLGMWLAYLMALAGVAFLAVGLSGGTLPWHFPIETSMARGRLMLPVDGILPLWTANVFVSDGSPPWTGSWTMGDRPALMAALLALFGRAFGSHRLPPAALFVTGAAMNALFVAPIPYLMRRLFPDRGVAPYLAFALMLNSFWFINVYFDWPKLFGAYFVLAGIAFALARRGRDGWLDAAVLGTMAGLASQCHGAAALTLPVAFVVYGIDAWRRLKWRASGVAAAFLALFVAVGIPWHIYKSHHPEIDTFRLLGQYVGPVPGAPAWDEQSKDTKVVIGAFVGSLRATPLADQLKMRLGEIGGLFDLKNVPLMFEHLMAGDFTGYFAVRRNGEFYQPTTLIGEDAIVIGVVAGLFTLIHRWRRRQTPGAAANGYGPLLCLLFVVISYALNAGAKWDYPYINHVGPYVEPVLASSIIHAWAFGAGKWARHVLLASSAALLTYFGLHGADAEGYSRFDFFHFVILGAYIAAYFLAAKNAAESMPKSAV